MALEEFLVNNTHIYMRGDVLSLYKGQAQWTQEHTDLLTKTLDSLVPGEMVTLDSNHFAISGEDERGTYSFFVNHPTYIQKLDAVSSDLAIKRIYLQMDRDRLLAHMAEIDKKLDQAYRALDANHVELKKHSESVRKS